MSERVAVFSRSKEISSSGISRSTMADDSSFSPIQSQENKSASASVSTGQISLKLMDVAPIKLSTIKDTKGRLSDLVEQKMAELNEICLPIQITAILPQVEELQRYDIYKCDDQVFITARVIRQDLMDKVEQKIIDTLESGLSYEEEIFKAVIYDGVTYNNLLYTSMEQTYLVSRFRLYNASVVYARDTNSLVLSVKG